MRKGILGSRYNSRNQWKSLDRKSGIFDGQSYASQIYESDSKEQRFDRQAILMVEEKQYEGNH